MKFLAIDYSTTKTGWALFQDDKLLQYGAISPSMKGISKFVYPKQQLLKIKSLAELISKLIEEDFDFIVIEEINRGKAAGRLSQKVLDAGHFFMLDAMPPSALEKVVYIDSNGRTGWRTILDLELSQLDKVYNKEARRYNKNAKTVKKRVIRSFKDLSVEYVNKTYGLSLTLKENDIADAISLGAAFWKGRQNGKI